MYSKVFKIHKKLIAIFHCFLDLASRYCHEKNKILKIIHLNRRISRMFSFNKAYKDAFYFIRNVSMFCCFVKKELYISFDMQESFTIIQNCLIFD